MNMLNRKLIRDLLHMRGQIIAITLVAACGIAAFVSLRNIYQSLLITQSTYYSDYRFAQVFVQLKRAPESIKGFINEISGIVTVQTRIVAEVTLDIPGLNEPGSARLISIPEKQTPILNDLHLVAGRWIEPNNRNEAIVSVAFAEKNQLKPGDSISAVINGQWTKLYIVGLALSPEFIYEIRGGEMFPDSRRFGVIWMGYQSLSAAFNMQGAFNNVVLSLAPTANERAVIEKLDLLLENYGGLGAYGREDQTSHHFISNEIDELRVNGTFTPALFLAVSAFLIHLVLSRLVIIQREQIAVLKAFGYGNISLAIHYLKLSLIAVSFGVVLGAGLGWYFGYKLTALYAEFFHFPVLHYKFDLSVFASAVAISFFSTSLGTISAVRKVIALSPAEAMSPEAPAQFRSGLLERLGLEKLLPLSTRVIVRNIERNPTKALLTIFGIAMSVSLLVVGFYFNDAITHIISLQFDKSQREDANIVFIEPRPITAAYNLISLSGVMRVEPYRMVPVRLRFGHKMRRVALLGLEPNGQLHQIIEVNNNVVNLPLNGIVINKKLAEILKVKINDELTFETLEGKKLVRQVRVVALANEVLGLSVYINRHALNDLLNESEIINGARLLIDDKEKAKLYTQLKHTPIVTSVVIPEVVLNNFNETLARTMGVSTTIIISFACIIVLGMVYNSARIALSERGRELASLRVLGFTTSEIATMLLGEQGLLTLVAIPIGYLIGWFFCKLIVEAIDTEMMRLPLIITSYNLTLSFIITICAALVSTIIVQRRLHHLNLIEVLKTRE